MAHFAELDENNKVIRVIVVSNDDCMKDGMEDEATGIAFCQRLLGGGRWVQTSYNNHFRRRYAGIGYTYDPVADVFIAPSPFPSWVLNEDYDWVAPVPYPNDGKKYWWDEDNGVWVEVEQ